VKFAIVGIPMGREASRISRLDILDIRIILSPLAAFGGLSRSLEHLVVLRSGNAFFNEPFVVAAPFLVLVRARSPRYFVAF
jgi:hypothetical protein